MLGSVFCYHLIDQAEIAGRKTRIALRFQLLADSKHESLARSRWGLSLVGFGIDNAFYARCYLGRSPALAAMRKVESENSAPVPLLRF